MTSLLELQRSFLEAILGQESAGLPVENLQGLEVYRANVRVSRRSALRAGYPIVERLVGCAFFAGMAECFIERYPSRSANLEDYGREFPDFIETFGPASCLPYLADVARFEAALDRMFTVPADEGEAAPPHLRFDDRVLLPRLRLARTSELFASRYPVHRIWAVNQPGADEEETVSLDETGPRALLRREGIDVLIEPLDGPEFDLLAAIAVGRSTAQAIAETAAPGFDPFAVLGRRCGEGVLRLATSS